MSDFRKQMQQGGRGGEQPQSMNAAHVDIIGTATDKQVQLRELGVALSGRVRATSVGLDGYAATFEEWEQVGRALKKIESGLQWAIGDWLNDGQKRFGTKYAGTVEALGFDYQTLRVYAYVAENVSLLIRINKLSFAHHRLVAPFSGNPNLQRQWLARALGGPNDKPWSLAKMKEAIDGRPQIDWHSDVLPRQERSLARFAAGVDTREQYEAARGALLRIVETLDAKWGKR